MIGLLLKFQDEKKMAEWFEDLKYNQVIPKDAAIYMMDSLDKVLAKYIVARVGDRPDAMLLEVKEGEVTEVRLGGKKLRAPYGSRKK